MASAIFPAIKTKAEAGTGLSTLGTMYFGEMPEAPTFPYWTFQLIDGRTDRAFGARYLEVFDIQFDIYHTSLNTLLTLQDALHTTFDNASFSLSSGTAIECVRKNDFSRKTLGMIDKNGNAVYQAISRYKLKVDQAW